MLMMINYFLFYFLLLTMFALWSNLWVYESVRFPGKYWASKRNRNLFNNRSLLRYLKNVFKNCYIFYDFGTFQPLVLFIVNASSFGFFSMNFPLALHYNFLEIEIQSLTFENFMNFIEFADKLFIDFPNIKHKMNFHRHPHVIFIDSFCEWQIFLELNFSCWILN